MGENMYYFLLDNQTGQITSIGLNETLKNEVRNHLISYLLLGNFSAEGEESIKQNTLSELLNYYEFRLLKSNTRFKF